MVGKCFVKQTRNNVFVVLVNKDTMQVELERSGGKLGYKGAGKRTRFVAELIGQDVGEKARKLAYKELEVYLRGGITALTRGVINGIVRKGVIIKEITFLRTIAHNGVRPKKKRRI